MACFVKHSKCQIKKIQINGVTAVFPSPCPFSLSCHKYQLNFFHIFHFWTFVFPFSDCPFWAIIIQVQENKNCTTTIDNKNLHRYNIFTNSRNFDPSSTSTSHKRTYSNQHRYSSPIHSLFHKQVYMNYSIRERSLYMKRPTILKGSICAHV